LKEFSGGRPTAAAGAESNDRTFRQIRTAGQMHSVKGSCVRRSAQAIPYTCACEIRLCLCVGSLQRDSPPVSFILEHLSEARSAGRRKRGRDNIGNVPIEPHLSMCVGAALPQLFANVMHHITGTYSYYNSRYIIVTGMYL